ncbi:MAG: glycerate kinase [Pseudanabaena sp. ELA607]
MSDEFFPAGHTTILAKWIQDGLHHSLQLAEIDVLTQTLCQDDDLCAVWGMSYEEDHQFGYEFTSYRLQLLRDSWGDLQGCLMGLGIDPLDGPILDTLWRWWLPFAEYLAWRVAQQNINHPPLIQGVLGVQGTGKTTLGMVMEILLAHLGYSCLSLSLDDFYKTHAQQQALRAEKPQLIWRGPPGTHDVDLAIDVLTKLKQGAIPVEIPQFDKSMHEGQGDRTTAKLCRHLPNVVLFEGWFVGAQPLPLERLEPWLPPIMTALDRQFAMDINQELGAYLPLWACLDGLVVIKPTDYQYSLEWRLEAERKLRAHSLSGMSDQQVKDFVHYFWKALHPQRFVQGLISQNNRKPDLSVANDDIGRKIMAADVRSPKLDFVVEFGAKRQLIGVWTS